MLNRCIQKPSRRAFAAGSLAALVSAALPAYLSDNPLDNDATPELARELDAALARFGGIMHRYRDHGEGQKGERHDPADNPRP